MKLAVFGATGGVGRELVERALGQGYQVQAFARTPSKLTVQHPSLTIFQGDVLKDLEAIGKTVQGVDCVLVTLGTQGLLTRKTVCSEGTRHILEAMRQHGVKRIIVCSSMGVGDSAPHVSGIVKFMLAKALQDKEAQEAILRESDRDWIIVRPTGLVNDAPRGNIAAVEGGPLPRAQIARADVAGFMLGQLASDRYLRRAPGLSWK